jgi:hypothetical protein
LFFQDQKVVEEMRFTKMLRVLAPCAAGLASFAVRADHPQTVGDVFIHLPNADGADRTLKATLTWGVNSDQGRRKYMEDRYCMVPSVNTKGRIVHVFGVFDGHGGDHAAVFCMERVPRALRKGAQNDQLLHETERALRTVLNGKLSRMYSACIVARC